MRSWIFRHRLRLRAIYAPPPALVPAPLPRRTGKSRRGHVVVERLGAHTVLRARRRTSRAARRKPAA